MAKQASKRPVLGRAKKLRDLPAYDPDIDTTRAEHYKGGYACPSCGYQDIKEHSPTCTMAAEAKEAGVTLPEYARSPSLWCPVISGYDDEKVRCIRCGKPVHEGQHRFPTRKVAIELQRSLKAVEDAVPREAARQKKWREVNPQEEAEMPKKVKEEKTNGKTPKAGKAAKADGKKSGLAKAQEANAGQRAELHAKKIHMLTKENPKREGTEAHKRFELYKNGMTVGEAIEAGITMSDIRYNEEHGHLELK